MTSDQLPVTILTGPTCSGKSALAMEMAAEKNGVIINADAMQTYRDLRIITARPTDEEMARAPHRLYGMLDATDMCTVARWIELAVPEIQHTWDENKLPILVGGTGMYLKSLMTGISEVPEIHQEIRCAVRKRMKEEGNDAFHHYLHSIDPVMASRLKPGDTQRLLRAAEVIESTGRSLADWQDAPTAPPLPQATFKVFVVSPPRQELYTRINARFEAMAKNGAVEEVKALKEKLYTPSPVGGELGWGLACSGGTDNAPLPASPLRGEGLIELPLLRAHGVPELMQYLDGEMTLEEAIQKAQQNTRNYAKRQCTWIRNQFPEAMAIKA